MRIVHIINSLDVGGAERLLSDMLPLMAQKNKVSLLVSNDVDNDFTRKVKSAGVDVITTGYKNPYSILTILSIARIAKGYDVVHVHLFPMVYWAVMASLISPMRLVYTEHSTSNRRREKWYFRPIEQLIYKRYKKVISISPQTQDALMKWLGTKKNDSRFVVINNGVNLSGFQEMKLDKQYPYTLMMISRFAPAKDQKTVIRSMQLLAEDVHVIFVGGGELLDECKALSQELGVQERTHFVGAQTDVVSWIAKADIGIQSSHWEGFGLTAVELMASGKPVIASNVDGLNQVVEGAGLLFEPGNAEDLAHKVSLLLDDSHYLHEISKRCKERATCYDIKEMMGKYNDVYRSLCSQR